MSRDLCHQRYWRERYCCGRSVRGHNQRRFVYRKLDLLYVDRASPYSNHSLSVVVLFLRTLKNVHRLIGNERRPSVLYQGKRGEGVGPAAETYPFPSLGQIKSTVDPVKLRPFCQGQKTYHLWIGTVWWQPVAIRGVGWACTSERKFGFIIMLRIQKFQNEEYGGL